MELTVKITPRVAAQVARRLRLAASVRSRSMPAVASEALDAALPSPEEIRAQLAAGQAGAVVIPGTAAGHRGPVPMTAAGASPAPAQPLDRGVGDGRVR